MAAAEVTPGGARELEQERFSLLTRTAQRLPVTLLLIDTLSMALLWRVGLPGIALAWFLVSTAQHGLRWWRVRRWMAATPTDVAAANRWLERIYIVQGGWRAVLVVAVFTQPLALEHNLLTVLCLGIGAGAVSTSGFSPRIFLAWSLLVCGALAAGWALQGGWLEIGLAALIVGFARLLYGQVVDEQKLVLALIAARNRAEEASRSKSRFMAAANHDLRQPLAALALNAGALSLLAERHPALLGELSARIDVALSHADSVLAGLVEISALDAGRIKAELEDIDLAALLDELGQRYLPVAQAQGLVLARAPLRRPLPVRSDARLLMRLLDNLLSNAVKFTTTGQVSITAEVLTDGRVRVSIRDTGRGIPAEEKARVFEEFYQLDNDARDRTHGQGLGLSIVRRHAELIGAELDLESTPGIGTRIDVTLPAAAAALGTPASPPGAPDKPTPRLCVLAIDDDDVVLDALRTLLISLGHDARAARSGEAALAALDDNAFQPQLLLVDYRLEYEDGIAVIDRLHARLGALPAIVLTGEVDARVHERLAARSFRVLTKPVDRTTLQAAIAAACRFAPGADRGT